jgi:hypothetical protein
LARPNNWITEFRPKLDREKRDTPSLGQGRPPPAPTPVCVEGDRRLHRRREKPTPGHPCPPSRATAAASRSGSPASLASYAVTMSTTPRHQGCHQFYAATTSRDAARYVDPKHPRRMYLLLWASYSNTICRPSCTLYLSSERKSRVQTLCPWKIWPPLLNNPSYRESERDQAVQAGSQWTDIYTLLHILSMMAYLQWTSHLSYQRRCIEKPSEWWHHCCMVRCVRC